MFLKKIVVLITAICVVSWADNEIVIAKTNANVFKNELHMQYEEPLYSVDQNEHLKVMQSKDLQYQVKNKEDQVGWISKNVCTSIIPSKSISFESATVDGYVDNPSFMDVFTAENDETTAISLNRSFKNALRENIDKETVMRSIP
jgi:hypothetical protein